MQYLALLISQERDLTPDQGATEMAAYQSFHAKAASAIRGGDALSPAATAVRISGGPDAPAITDGPFAEAAEVAGVMIPASSIVSVCFNQASRDPKVFANAETFDPHRGELRRHFSFGRGIHVCVGAPLARLEGTVLLKRLSEKVKCLRLAGPDAVRYDWASLAVRGMTSLKVHYALLHGQAGQSGRAA